MKTITIELELDEAVKLLSVCNAAIVSDEESLRYGAQSLNIKESTKRSLDIMWKIKNKIKKAINIQYGRDLLSTTHTP